MQTVLECTTILKKSKAEMFKNIKLGDRILISFRFGQSHWAINGVKALDLTAENLRTHEKVTKSIANMENCMKPFEFRTLDDYHALCKINDTVYYPDKDTNYVFECEVSEIAIIKDPQTSKPKIIYRTAFYNGNNDVEREFEFDDSDFDNCKVFFDEKQAKLQLFRYNHTN